MLKSILVAILVIIIAVVAAPYFLRQEQVVSFLENKLILPDNNKIKIESPVKFGIFPYAHFSTEKASVISPDGLTKKFENLLFGFNFNGLITRNIGFDLQAKYNGTDYKANVGVEDYSKFLKNEDTLIDIKVENPVPFTLKGDLKSTDNGKELKNFTLTHKQTTARGNIVFKNLANGINSISGSVVLDSENIEDLRKLTDLKNYNDDFNQISGKGKAVISFSTTGKSDYDYKRNLDAEGSLKVTNAAIYGIDLEEFLRSMGQVKMEKNPNKSIPIDSIDSSFVSNKGLVNISNFKMLNNKGTATGNGTVDIADERINSNLNINASVEGNSVNLPLLITGDLKNPIVKPMAIKAIITNASQLKQFTDQIKNEKVRDTLKSVFDVLGGVGQDEPVQQKTPGQ